MNYKSDLSKATKNLNTVKDRLSQRNYTGDEVKLTKYKTQIEKCKKDVESFNEQLKVAQGADILIAKKELELRKVDCANILKAIETIQVLLNGRAQLSQSLKKFGNKIVYIQGKIKHYEVYMQYLFICNFKFT